MSQIILVSKNDKKLGYTSLEEGHTGRGKRHRAFVTLLFNSKNQVLLQKRKHRLFDSFWDFTAISHPLKNGKGEESYQEASDRALAKEMGIGHVDVKKIGAFNYFAREGKNCENEYCAILVGNYDGVYRQNAKEIYQSGWVDFGKFKQDLRKNPKKYTPWARLAVNKLPKTNLFLEELSQFLIKYEGYRKEFFQKKQKNNSKHREILNFYRDLEEFTRGGKKLRAFLVYLGFLSARGNKADIKKVLPIALALEILHSFFLIHDDIMDRADIRRGKPSIHKKYSKFGEHFGVSVGILIGDIAAFEAFKLISESNFDPETKNKVLNFVLSSSLDTGFGQALDVFYSQKEPTEAIIWEILDNKTGKYSVICPLSVGSTLAGGTRAQLAAISKFGYYAGRAFQLHDDVLGVFGDEKIIGKSILSDICEGKNTLLIAKGFSLANDFNRKKLKKLWGKPDANVEDLNLVKNILSSCGALSKVEETKINLVKSAKQGITLITKEQKLVQIYLEMADFIVGRAS